MPDQKPPPAPDTILTARAAMEAAFESGTVWDAPEKDLLLYLRSITSGKMVNYSEAPININRAITIMNILNSHYTERRMAQERSTNNIRFVVTITIAVIAIIVAILKK